MILGKPYLLALCRIARISILQEIGDLLGIGKGLWDVGRGHCFRTQRHQGTGWSGADRAGQYSFVQFCCLSVLLSWGWGPRAAGAAGVKAGGVLQAFLGKISTSGPNLSPLCLIHIFFLDSVLSNTLVNRFINYTLKRSDKSMTLS